MSHFRRVLGALRTALDNPGLHSRRVNIWLGRNGGFEPLEARVLLSATPYHLTFDDEFNVLDLADKSGTDTGWMVRDYWYNPYHVDDNGNPKELQYYADPVVDGYNPFSVSNGILTIRAEPTPQGVDADGQPYVSGELTTTKGSTSPQDPNSVGWSQQYGYFEVRAKLPEGQGLWPAFWLLPEDGTWPPEYDVFEVLGHDTDTIHVTSHWGTSSNPLSDTYAYNGVDAADGFHVYGFEWTPEVIKWYVDGVFVEQQANRVDEPMYMLLNMTVGGSWPGSPDGTTPWPAEMEVDYVRAYSNDPNLPAITPQSGYSASAYIPDGTQGNPITLATIADAYVRDGSYAGSNFGSNPTVVVKQGSSAGPNREAYLKFDISGLTSVDQAQLRLYVTAASSPTDASISVYGASNTSWSEGGINWNNKPATSGAALDTVTVNNKEAGWYQWDISGYVQQQRALGNDTITLVLKSNTVTAPLYEFRSEEASGTSFDPHLLVLPEVIEVELGVAADAFVRDGAYANDNFGSEDRLFVKKGSVSYSREAYIKFDLSSVADVQGAKLRLYNLGTPTDGTATVQVFAASDTTWGEGTITWNTKPATSGAALSSVTLNSANAGWYQWDVTSYLQQEKAAGRDVVTLVVKSSGVTNPGFPFLAEEYAGTEYDPRLVLTTTADAGGLIYSEDFNDGTADGLTAAAGTWSVNASNRYVGERLGGANMWAISTIDATTALPSDFDFSAVAQTTEVGGWENAVLIFDYTGSQNFKFAGLFSGADEWRIGQVVNGSKTVLASTSQAINEDTDYALTLEVRGGGVALKVNGNTQVSYTFGGTISDGQLGLGVENGRAIFDDLSVATPAGMMQSSSFAALSADEPTSEPGKASKGNGSLKRTKQDEALLAYFSTQLASAQQGDAEEEEAL